MVLPIIFNLRQRRRRRAEHRGLRLLDHAAYQDKEREKNERVRNWKTEETRKHTSDYKASGKATRLIRKMLLSPRNRASLRVKSDVFVFFLNGFGYTYEALFVLYTILFLSCQLQRAGISNVFQASN